MDSTIYCKPHRVYGCGLSATKLCSDVRGKHRNYTDTNWMWWHIWEAHTGQKSWKMEHKQKMGGRKYTSYKIYITLLDPCGWVKFNLILWFLLREQFVAVQIAKLFDNEAIIRSFVFSCHLELKHRSQFSCHLLFICEFLIPKNSTKSLPFTGEIMLFRVAIRFSLQPNQETEFRCFALH